MFLWSQETNLRFVCHGEKSQLVFASDTSFGTPSGTQYGTPFDTMSCTKTMGDLVVSISMANDGGIINMGFSCARGIQLLNLWQLNLGCYAGRLLARLISRNHWKLGHLKCDLLFLERVDPSSGRPLKLYNHLLIPLIVTWREKNFIIWYIHYHHFFHILCFYA